jgi:hypothetical protein
VAYRMRMHKSKQPSGFFVISTSTVMPNLVSYYLPAIHQYWSDPKQAQHRSRNVDLQTPGRSGVEVNIANRTKAMQADVCE